MRSAPAFLAIGSKSGNVLATHIISPGDFHIRIPLSIHRLEFGLSNARSAPLNASMRISFLREEWRDRSLLHGLDARLRRIDLRFLCSIDCID